MTMFKKVFIFLSLFGALNVHAQDYRLLLEQQMLQTPAAQQFRQSLPAPMDVEPEGTEMLYDMSAYFYTKSGVYYATGIAERMRYDNGGNTVFVNSLFPTTLKDLWHWGIVEDNQVTFSKDYECYTFDYNGDGSEVYHLKAGELIFDENGISGVKDIVFTKNGDHIYLDDNLQSPSRYIALYDNDEGRITIWDYTLCTDFKLFTQTTTSIPETANRQIYTYKFDDENGVQHKMTGYVAVDGNDYYFDALNTYCGIVKGTLEGDKITIKSGQYIGHDSGYFLYFNGGYKESENGNVECCDAVFTLTDKGFILMDETVNQLTVITTKDGSHFSICSNVVTYPVDLEGIQSVKAEKCDAIWYDLNGRRTNGALNHGLYISEGKKILIK